jgi:hypothetical protein
MCAVHNADLEVEGEGHVDDAADGGDGVQSVAEVVDEDESF